MSDDDLPVCPNCHKHVDQHAEGVVYAVASAGLGKVTPHTLRRSFASLAARGDVDAVQASRMTGHSLDTWIRHYAGDHGKRQRDEARQRTLDAGFGLASDAPEVDECADTSPDMNSRR